MKDTPLATHIYDPARLEALYATALLDSPSEKAFDRLSRLAAAILDAPVALVSLIDADRQFFKSCIGLPEPWNSERQTPLSHSFCQHNRVNGKPLVIGDARKDPLLSDNPAIWDLQVVAYLGIPLVTGEGYVIGSFCVIDSKPREWSPKEVEILIDLSESVMSEIQLRTEIAARGQAEEERDELVVVNERLQREIKARKTAEKKNRQLQNQLHHSRRIEAVGRLAGGVAHDLNNLLTPILGYGELLADEGDYHPRHGKFISEINKAGYRARDLVRQLLTFSRRQPLEYKVVNLNTVIADFRDFLRYTLPGTIELRTRLHQSALRIVGDTGQIEQILLNLALNGADAMSAGGILRIETKEIAGPSENEEGLPLLSPGKYAELTVRDSGTGICDAVREKMFEPFFTTKGEKGSGLGLATVYGIVKQHGGEIAVNSDKDSGTLFRIVLPLTDRNEEEPAVSDLDTAVLTGSETILVVEDNDAVRRLLTTLLTDLGYLVHEARDGEEAALCLTKGNSSFQLLLADLILPGKNGVELSQLGREHHPGLKTLFMSGHMEDALIYRSTIDENGGFIQKPFSKRDLAIALRGILNEKS